MGHFGRATLALLALACGGCTQLTLAWADLKPRGASATPPIFSAVGATGSGNAAPMRLAAASEAPATPPTIDEWERARVPALRAALAQHVYGVMPDATVTRVVSKRMLDEAAFGGRGSLEEYIISATATYGETSVDTRKVLGSRGFPMIVATPSASAGPAPVILVESFCSRWSMVDHPGLTKPAGEDGAGGAVGGIAAYVFGRYICRPPFEEILEAGYAVAAISPWEIVPDHSTNGPAELRRLSAGYADDETRWGAVAAWGWSFSRMVDALEGDPRFDQDAVIAWGHSRYGKAALVAAAYDARIDGVISHQSGTGGASLNRRKKGESLKAITKSYPHWFAPAYAAYAGREAEMPIDQHMLLALIAPRPVLLGNARRDVWSDPNGAFRAAIGADPVYELYGRRGLDQPDLRSFDPTAELSFWIRPGTHGVVEEDWPAFLAFLDAHFAPARP